MDASKGLETRLMDAEFFAENEIVTIVPTSRLPVIRFVRGEFGPFQPSVAVDVPLWLALALKKVKRCKIQVPRWMELKELEERIERERLAKNNLTEVPFYYAEITSLLLHYASDDMSSPATVRRGIEDLTSLRSNKLKRFMQTQVKERVHAVKLNNICSTEINNTRPIINEVLGTFYRTRRFDVNLTDSSSATQTASVYSSTRPRTLRRFQ